MEQKTEAQKPTPGCIKRLRLEWKEILRSPIPQILTVPDEEDILTWYYTLLGSTDTPYEGGCYFGTIVFKPDYPFKPPSILMKTPSGRFKTDTRLCLSISDFHPETWSPTWSVSAILLGLLSFMLENEVTYGSITCSAEERRNFATASLDFNKTIPTFRKYFPQLCEDI